jgi:UvrD-like helicase C-terminal domain
MAATYLANAIAWHPGQAVAVITPSKVGGFATGVVERVSTRPSGRQQNGPYNIEWERSDDEEVLFHAANLNLPNDGEMGATLDALSAAGTHPALVMCREWVQRSHKLSDRTLFEPVAVCEQLTACVTRHRRYNRPSQAKNREFDGVVVLWPYTVAGSAEQKRRLLYNAITRAKRSCTVLVQNENLLQGPPFRAPATG